MAFLLILLPPILFLFVIPNNLLFYFRNLLWNIKKKHNMIYALVKNVSFAIILDQDTFIS